MLTTQILTIALMFIMTFVIYKTLGPPRRGLLYSREDWLKWNEFIRSHSLGGVLTTLNVIGTLTSLAGCYVFLMGSSKLFGIFILLCSITLIPGAYITVQFSSRIMSSPRLQELLNSPDQTGGVIAALFWSPDTASEHTSRLVKWISLLNLTAVLWMEFTVFAEIGKHLLELKSPVAAPILLFGSCFAISAFTLMYGLRGFVFADLFHVPLVALAALAILIGCSVLMYVDWTSLPPVNEILTPSLAISACVLFALHNLVLNGLQLLTTEGHWLRLWIFREQETRRLRLSTILTGVVWGILSAIGLLTFFLSDGKIAVPAVADVLSHLSKLSAAFIVAFWIGGIAALFSTSDAILYAALLVWNFRPAEGRLHDQVLRDIRPMRTAAGLALVATGAYVGLIQFLKLPIEQLVFLVFSLHLNLFPAFVRAYRGFQQSPWYIGVSFVFYVAFGLAGIVQPARGFEWTLAATLVPVAVAIVAAFGRRPVRISPARSLDGEVVHERTT